MNWALCALGITIICAFTLTQNGTTVNTVSLSNAYGTLASTRCLTDRKGAESLATALWPHLLEQFQVLVRQVT